MTIGVRVGAVEDGFGRFTPGRIPILLDQIDAAANAASGNDDVAGGDRERRAVLLIYAADAAGLTSVRVNAGDVMAKEQAQVGGVFVLFQPG